jgi:IS605 OrfB family transposase
MTADGTVHAKGVIHLDGDEDRLNRLINRKRMYEQAGKKSHSIYRMVTAANRQLSIDTGRELIRIAILYNVDCIVFEHLDRSGRKKGKKYRERIHMWRADDVQERLTLQAHRNGMRISRVCAWGTSKLAFDGSGVVSRGRDAGLTTYSVCRFPNGKVYNCDLSASMNIGARYFLREYAKLPGCPELPKTPQRTYATLVALCHTMAA